MAVRLEFSKAGQNTIIKVVEPLIGNGMVWTKIKPHQGKDRRRVSYEAAITVNNLFHKHRGSDLEPLDQLTNRITTELTQFYAKPPEREDSIVVCRLVQDTDTQKIEVEVELQSNAKPGFASQLRVDADDWKLEAKVGVSGGALAEFQNTFYEDRHDREEVAKKAMEALNDLRAAADRAGRKITVGT
jgi:hypothetical protein